MAEAWLYNDNPGSQKRFKVDGLGARHLLNCHASGVVLHISLPLQKTSTTLRVQNASAS